MRALAFAREFAIAADGARDDRLFHRLGYEQRDGEPFSQAGQRDHVGRGEKIADIFAEAEKMNYVLQAETRGLVFQTALDGSRSRKPEFDWARNLAPHSRHRREKIVESLAVGKTADGDDEEI